MPDYKHRSIELVPRRQADGAWHCEYRIIEFRQTCWGYHKGCPDGGFPSREEAIAAALEEAKPIVDSLEFPAQIPRSESGSVLGTYGDRVRRLTFSFAQSLVCFGMRVPRRVFFPPNWRKY